MAAPKGKAKQVKVCTLKTWQFGEDISFKSTEKDSVNYVTSVWCNVCRRQKDNLNKDSRIRGAAAASSEIYIIGTKFITKHNVSRHIGGKVRLACPFLL